MKIGIPRALLFYRYGVLWKSFFEALGCEVIISEESNQTILSQGVEDGIGEYCLPVKIYLGHVRSLIHQCDMILVPRFEKIKKEQEFCIRFWGVPDIVCSTFKGVSIIGYNLKEQKPFTELLGFLSMAKVLGRNKKQGLAAYRFALRKQALHDTHYRKMQEEQLEKNGNKVLLVAHPYVIHDALIGKPLVNMLRECGGTPIFADKCEPVICRQKSKEITKDLFWHLNQEIVGAIPHVMDQVDGILLVSAFPCGTDSLVNELVMRRVAQLPISMIVLDEQQVEAGLQTRMECFMDLIKGRRHHDHVFKACHCLNQIGQEPTPELYISRLTEVFHEVKRVLTPDGVCCFRLCSACYSIYFF